MSADDNFFKEIQESFLQEASDLLERVEALSLELEKNPASEPTYEELARLAHNFKGSGKAVGFNHISTFAHKIEDYILAIKNKKIAPTSDVLDLLFKCLDQIKGNVDELKFDKSITIDHQELIQELNNKIQNPNITQSEASDELNLDKNLEVANYPLEKDQSSLAINKISNSEKLEITKGKIVKPTVSDTVLRVQKSKIDFLLEAFGEQVILQSTLEQYKYDMESHKDILLKTIAQLSKLTFELQSHALSLTMIQFGPTFVKLERAARDAARDCGKQIQILFEGAETEVDKTLVDSLSDALTHMIRNAVDHAIEDVQIRSTAGKNVAGTIRVSCRRNGGQLWIEVQDDGKGLDVEKIKLKALEKEIINLSQFETMTNDEVYKLIFANGFSTKEKVSELSGRGVGMNVVSETVEKINGSIQIESEIGKGTLFRLKLPLTLSIFNGAIVRIANRKFVIPNADISEVGQIKTAELRLLNSKKSVLKIREEIYDVIDLRAKLGHEPLMTAEFLPIVISKKLGLKAFLVDEIIGMQKVVQKPLSDDVKSRPEYSAGTILSDGTPSVVVNLNILAHSA